MKPIKGALSCSTNHTDGTVLVEVHGIMAALSEVHRKMSRVVNRTLILFLLQFASEDLASKASRLEIDYFGADLILTHVMEERPPLSLTKKVKVSLLPDDFSDVS